MNWALVDAGTFDYAADAWGYTYGAAVEWYRGNWTLRGGLFDLSVVPNNTDLDPRFGQFQWVGEIERRHELWGLPGKVAVTGFLSRGRMGRFDDAVLLSNLTGQPADIAAVRRYQSRYGISFNAEQPCRRGDPIEAELAAAGHPGEMNRCVQAGRIRYGGLVEALVAPGAAHVDARIKAVPVVVGRICGRHLVRRCSRQVGTDRGRRSRQHKACSGQARPLQD